ncbi:MAG: hypothetical protein KDA53_02150 [Hyphomonas sp.]|nr:hypothetical protein [Hyphomonas sp.]
MRAGILILAALCAGGAALADVQKVQATIPGDVEFEAPEELQLMEEGVVWLDLTMMPEMEPSIELMDGTYVPSGCEAHGPIDGVKRVDVATGSNHLLLDVRPGSPDQYGANLVSCDYAPMYSSDTELGHVIQVQGCYYAHATSIPTAVWWILNPLPGEACHYGD